MDYLPIILYVGAVILNCVPGLRGALQVLVQPDGQYSVAVDGKTWLNSGPTFFNKDGRRWSTDDPANQLVLLSARNITEGGYVTNWIETQFTYSYGNGSDTVMTAIRTFTEADTVIFTQTFVSESSNTSLLGEVSFNETASGFPSFHVSDPQEELGFLSFGGYMFGDTDKTTGRFTSSTNNINDGISGGPLALFNRKGQAVIISPYDNFMASSLWHDGKPGGHVTWGIMGGVNHIPANFTYRTIIRYADSINEAFTLWGEKLASQYSVQYDSNSRAGNQSQDISLNYLRYWTDNGAFYYYHTETKVTYEGTLKDVKAYAEDHSIPYKYLQLDSWWYPKDVPYKAVTSWTPKQSMFPHGLKALSDFTGWPFVAHNRYWSRDAVYAKQNNGSFEWIIGRYGSLPNDLEFWRFLFKQAKAWGLAVYEQDWLNIQTRYMAELQTSLTLGRNWLMQMGQAAAEQGLTIQYCMATARHAYQSLEIPVVTQARVSDDYQYLRPDQWKIGVTSIFADALGVIPYKDTFWTASVQPGNPYGKIEPYPALEAAVSSLSAGPVGPSDGVGHTDKDLLMRCCRQDGTLLKPSKPAKAIDKQLIQAAYNPGSIAGEVWATYTDVRVNTTMAGRYGVLFAANVSGPFTVNPASDFWFDMPERGIYYPYNDPSKWFYYNTSTVLDLQECSTENFCLYYFSPIIDSSVITAVLGETGKWIPMAPKRFSNVFVAHDYVTLTLTGALGEQVPVSYILNGQVFTAKCSISKFNTTTDCNLIWSTVSSSCPPGSAMVDAVVVIVTLIGALWNTWRD